MYKQCKDKRSERKQRQEELRQKEAGDKLAEEIGGPFKRVRARRKAEREALVFCKSYAEEREWCYQNDLDFRVLPEEAKYNKLVVEFCFVDRRNKIAREIELRMKVYV